MVSHKSNRQAFLCLYAFASLGLLLTAPYLSAQTTAALAGRVTDDTSASIVGAKVTIVNEATKDTVDTVTSAEGTYSFPVLLPGTYTIQVEAKGFKTSRQSGLTVYAGSRATAPVSVLAVGSINETVTVESSEEVLLTENGSLGATLDAKDIEQLALVSRNVDDLVRVLPGVTIHPNGTGGGLNNSDVQADVEGSGALQGGVGINGAPQDGGTSVLLDGADINDPGCNCDQIANVLPSMVQEVSVLSSSYGADVAHGPVIVSNISKSGSAQYHGEGYFYAKNDALNANSAYNNGNGIPRGTAHYYDPGGNIGGPVPFTHKRLQFWFGYEKFIQNTGNSTTLTSYIPTADMLSGNFTATTANSALCPSGFSSTTTGTYCNNLTGTVLPDGSIIGVSANRPAGVIPAQFLSTPAGIDGLALTKVWPAANATPTAANNYENFILAVPGVVDGYIYRARVDYNFSDRTKAYVSYQFGTETSPASGGGAHIYWTPGNSIPFPGGGLTSSEKTYVFSGHFIHTFTETLTNEAIATLGNAHNATIIPNPGAISKATLGYTGSTIFNTGDLFIPSYGSAGNQTFPDLSQQDIFTNGAYNLLKPQPSLADNLIKVFGAHTVKLGLFYEMVDNNQGGFNTPNGSLGFGTGGNVNNNAVTLTPMGSPNNPLANLILGNATSYSESSSNPTQDLAAKFFAFYADDSWKATRRLSVEYGLRFDHIGNWYDRGNAGVPVFLASRVANDFAENIVDPGLQYHAINSAVPKSGVTGTLLNLSPRLGVSYDVFGTGNTLVRGGLGVYRFGDNWGDYSGGLGLAQGVKGYSLPGGYSVTLNQIGTGSKAPALTPAAAGSGTIESAADPNDHYSPLSYSYNLTISQRLPLNALIEVSYVGNQAKHVLLGGGSGATLGAGTPLTNLNKEPLGALFKPDPITGITAPNPENVTKNLNGSSTGNQNSDYYALGYAYGTNGVYLLSHVGYSNYNGLQIALAKRSAHLNLNLNYTRSKTLGTDLNEDPFTLRGNYGVESLDRPNVINTSFSYNDLKTYRGGNRILSGAVNNWLISAITTYQSGGNLQALDNPNFSFSNSYTGTLPAGVGTSLSAATYFGTNAGISIQPELTCSPLSGRGSDQFLTDKCFAVPAIGTNGPRNYPYIKGVAYFDSDLALAKSFHITEGQRVTFRASAYDWLNHPLNAFSGNQLNLYYTTDYTSKVSTLSSQTVPNFGTTTQKAGGDTRRIVELGLKYEF
jgi:hypothetical protein